MRKKHFLTLETLLREVRPQWIARHGAESYGAMVDLIARFCGIWARKFDSRRFRAEVYRE
jgi:hypothetical protein